MRVGRRFVTTIEEGEREGRLQVERIVPERFAEAKRLRLRLRDKPLISFTDITTMIIMQELRSLRIITADGHFRHVGFRFELLP